MHVYAGSGKSLLVTQIAFPKGICEQIYTTVDPYKTRGVQDTTNERDGIFADSLALQLGEIVEKPAEILKLMHSIVVKP